MPLDELVGGLFHVIGRLVVQFFVEFIFELLIKGAGYLILLPFHRKRELDPDGAAVIFTGIFFWIALISIIYFLTASDFRIFYRNPATQN